MILIFVKPNKTVVSRAKKIHIFPLLLVVALAMCIQPWLSSCDGDTSVNDAKQIKKIAIDFARSDSSDFSGKFLSRLDSTRITDRTDADTLFIRVQRMVRNLLSQGKHLQAIDLLENIEKELLDSHGLTSQRMLAATYVCLGAAYAETGMPGIGLDYYEKGLEVTADTSLYLHRAMLLNNIAVLLHLQPSRQSGAILSQSPRNKQETQLAGRDISQLL